MQIFAGSVTFLVNTNIQASPKDILIPLSIDLPLTTECAIELTVGGTSQMLLLLLVLGTGPTSPLKPL